MNNIISPFQMKKNMIVSYAIEQMEATQEYERTSVSLGVDYKISDVVKMEELLNARVDLFVELMGKTEQEEKVFVIKLDMMGIFEGNVEQIGENKFKDMVKVNGISTLIQLSRAYVTATTALSGFSSPINFPMVNVFELIKRKDEKG